MYKFFLLPLIVFLLLTMGLVPAFSQNKLVILAFGPGHPMHLIATKLLPEAYKQIGYDVEFKTVPPMRSIFMLENSEADGFIFADDAFANSHPKIVKVNSPIGYDYIVVYTKNNISFKVQGWKSLKPYSIGYIVGDTLVEKNIKGMKGDPAQTPTMAYDKLRGGRTNVAVLPRTLDPSFAKKYPDLKILMPPLEAISLYTFLSPKRADLAPKLAKVLADMKASGRIDVITKQIEAEFSK